MRTQATTRTAKNQAAAVVARAKASAVKAAPKKAPKIDPALIEKLDGLSLRRLRFCLFAQVLDAPTERATKLITKDLYQSDIDTVRDFVRTHLMHQVAALSGKKGEQE